MTLPFPFRPNMRSAAVITYTDQTQNSSAQVTYTFSTRAIGSAAVNRYVICSVETNGTGAAISSVTIGGVGATQIVNALNSSGRVSIWIAAVPTGTTATVVVVFAGGGENRCGIGLWAAYGINPTAFDSKSSTANPGSVSLAIPYNGVVVGVAIGISATFTWTVLSENFDTTIGSTVTHTGASAAIGTATSGTTITVTRSSTAASDNFCAASFGAA